MKTNKQPKDKQSSNLGYRGAPAILSVRPKVTLNDALEPIIVMGEALFKHKPWEGETEAIVTFYWLVCDDNGLPIHSSSVTDDEEEGFVRTFTFPNNNLIGDNGFESLYEVTNYPARLKKFGNCVCLALWTWFRVS